MRKKTLQAVIIALGILGSTFTVSAMGNTSVENAVLQNQNVETEKPGEDGETDSQPESGWIESDKGWQYKDEAGNLLKDSWLEIENIWYYLGEDGTMQTGWQQIDGEWYYLGNDGIMQTGWIAPGDGRWYYADKSGIMQLGWVAPGDGHWYYANGSGAIELGWVAPGDGHWYYANGSGAIELGWVAPGDGHWYYADGNGVIQLGWFQAADGRWYYADGNGVMQTGWINPKKDKWYYLGNNGAMQTDWIAPGDGYWYYAGADGAMQTGWILTGENNWYYAYKSGTIAVNTWEKKDGHWYWFDESGLMAQGWKYIGRYKYYFNNSGHLLQDLDGVLGRQSSYEVTINRKRCQVTVYAKDGSNGYIIPAKTFTCSVGLSSTPTPTGTFYTPDKYRWHTLMGPSYGQYCTRITGGILFHSVAGYNMTSYNIRARDYNKLGSPASHGCVRLTVRDAKWIYDNCKLGTKVTISDYAATPFDKPATIKIPASQNWDPTDPNI